MLTFAILRSRGDSARGREAPRVSSRGTWAPSCLGVSLLRTARQSAGRTGNPRPFLNKFRVVMKQSISKLLCLHEHSRRSVVKRIPEGITSVVCKCVQLFP